MQSVLRIDDGLDKRADMEAIIKEIGGSERVLQNLGILDEQKHSKAHATKMPDEDAKLWDASIKWVLDFRPFF